MPRAQRVHLQVDADHAGRRDQRVRRRAPDAVGREQRHFARVGHALRSGAGVGAAAVGDDDLRQSLAPRQVLFADQQRSRLGAIRGEDAGGRHRTGRGDDGQIGPARRLDAARDARRAETLPAP